MFWKVLSILIRCDDVSFAVTRPLPLNGVFSTGPAFQSLRQPEVSVFQWENRKRVESLETQWSQASHGIQPSAEYPKGEWHQSKYLAAKVSEGSQGVRSSPGKMAKKKYRLGKSGALHSTVPQFWFVHIFVVFGTFILYIEHVSRIASFVQQNAVQRKAGETNPHDCLRSPLGLLST